MNQRAMGNHCRDWEAEIRGVEERARAAFLAADIATLEELWADGFVVDFPLQEVLETQPLMALPRSGRIRHTSYEHEIEPMTRYEDEVVVIARNRVPDPPDGLISRRRYTNVWRLENGRWRSIARYAHLASREAGG